MKILLDENLPQKLVAALRREGYEVESVRRLRLQGLDDGKLYEFARDRFDLCFTRDAGFRNLVRQDRQPARLKLLRVTLHPSSLALENLECYSQRFLTTPCGLARARGRAREFLASNKSRIDNQRRRSCFIKRQG